MKHLILILCLLLTACGDDNFRKIEKLDGFRILAVDATAPEVAPGGGSNLRLFVSDPTGPSGGRGITGTMLTCIDPGIALGASVACDHDPSRLSVPFTIDTRGADFQNNLGTAFTAALPVTVPATILLGRSAREQNNGVGYIAIFSFTVDNQMVSVFKRILASNRASKNTNPTGSAIQLNGTAIASPPLKGDGLNMTSSVPETYSFINVDASTETIIEDQQVAWYVSQGEFNKSKASVGEVVKLTESPPVSDYLLIGIVRDDRGGLEVVRIKIP